MFEQFFGLSENPFNVTPDPRFLFLSKAHDEALSYLKYGIEQRKGFIMITGEVGAGKTPICRALLSSLPRTVRPALILTPALSAVEPLQAINRIRHRVVPHVEEGAARRALQLSHQDPSSRARNAVRITTVSEPGARGPRADPVLSNLETGRRSSADSLWASPSSSRCCQSLRHEADRRQ